MSTTGILRNKTCVPVRSKQIVTHAFRLFLDFLLSLIKGDILISRSTSKTLIYCSYIIMKKTTQQGLCHIPDCWNWNPARKRPLDAIFVPPPSGETNTTIDDCDYSIDGAIHDETIVINEDVFHDCHEYDYSKLDEYYKLLGQSQSFDPTDDLVLQLRNEQDLQYMLSCLSDDELEAAARTSYLYLKSSHKKNQGALQKQAAVAMARRYLASKKQVPLALRCMKKTLEFRTSMDMDRLRQAFVNMDRNADKVGKRCSDPLLTFPEKLAQRLSSQQSYVMGYDKEGRATYVFVPRCNRGHDREWTLKETLYTMERALACSEARFHQNTDESSSQDGQHITTINAVIDFTGFDIFRHTPSLAIGKDFLLTLGKHYVGCFEKIFILNAPPGFPLLWKLFSKFVGTSTRQKIVFAKRNDKILQDYYTPSEAAEWMMEGGTKHRDLDLDDYLYSTPFDQAFDEQELVQEWILNLLEMKSA